MSREGDRVISQIDPWLNEVWDARGTDLLITAAAPPLIRVDGKIRPVEGFAPLSVEGVESIAQDVLGAELWGRFEAEREVDFAFSWRDKARLRCNAFHQRE